jgi:hypothetical protein
MIGAIGRDVKRAPPASAHDARGWSAMVVRGCSMHCGLREAPPLLGATVSLLLAGCVATQNTPQQEWVYKTFNECKAETGAHNVSIDRVTPDGQIYYSAAQTQSDANRVFACMQNKPGLPRGR